MLLQTSLIYHLNYSTIAVHVSQMFTMIFVYSLCVIACWLTEVSYEVVYYQQVIELCILLNRIYLNKFKYLKM